MTLLMDNLPSWKAYPKRSKSIICATEKNNSSSYGRVYYIYPTDECDIGIVPANDVWDGFIKALHDTSVNNFNSILEKNHISDKSFSEMKRDLILYFENELTTRFKAYKKNNINEWSQKKFDDIVASIYKDIRRYNFCNMLNEYIKNSLSSVDKGGNPLSIMDYLNDKLSPDRNGFKLNNDTKMYGGKEIWIGNGYMVAIATRFKDELEKDGLL